MFRCVILHKKALFATLGLGRVFREKVDFII